MSHENVSNHKMHSEFYDLSSQTAEKINKAKEEGRKIIAVGTTALRVLEFCSNKEGEVLPGKGFCDLFILPGFPFRVANGLITNFHQSGSTLLCLVSAFLGLSQIKTLYKEAIDQKYRFHSYGDCCLFFR